MQKNIPDRPRLLIVSDTAIAKTASGEIVGFEPVVREIENFSYLFSKITWIGYDYSYENSRRNMRSPSGVEIEYIFLPRTGGRTLWKKFEVLINMFPIMLRVYSEIKKHDVIHSRAPSMPAFWAIVVSLFDAQRTFWHKYAGSWVDNDAAPFYKLQRFLLKYAKKSCVTINGKWPNQEEHILSFENPCLTDREYAQATDSISKKTFSGKFEFCFIGNLNDAKGVGKIIKALNGLKNDRIGTIHFIGDGEKRSEYENAIRYFNARFYGFLPRKDIEALLPNMHFLLLPSDSEGFPKVVAEASAYGVIPVVSSVSSIPQYIKDGENGFLLQDNTVLDLKEKIEEILIIDEDILRKISLNTSELAKIFTYNHYNKKIQTKILEKHE